MRYNISQNDARKCDTGAFWVHGRVLDADVHNNSIYLDDGGTGIHAGVYIANLDYGDLDEDDQYRSKTVQLHSCTVQPETQSVLNWVETGGPQDS